ncbi:sigma-54 interaction domain-containing protein [Camelliibacillus cellulosilyticus]|uniref:Sigma-54 interaction domain-containing protein n=1 Tax=Camelliibacillus cellulosilyticus TaxID=2174486 RepID=A0ABV9GNF5_9BACL
MANLPDCQPILEAVAKVLNLEVTLVNHQMVRIAGTGPCRHRIGERLHPETAFGQALKSGMTIRVENPRTSKLCSNCELRSICKETAHLACPIQGDAPAGVLGLVAFTDHQKEQLLGRVDSYAEFLDSLTRLIGETLRAHPKVDTIKHSFDDIIHRSGTMMMAIQKAERVAGTNATVMLRGESGTGKELLARAIHAESSRKSGPFIAVNCAAIPSELLESELFGYVEGAFTGARKQGKPGYFELANHGTLFLDEIADMPLALQAKLLRVIQNLEVTRLGGIKPIKLDIRLITATHQNLEALIQQKRFREDLYYRLNVFPLTIPPLRERYEDILPLAKEILQQKSTKLQRSNLSFSEAAKRRIQHYPWPGNIRELENAIEYAVIMTDGKKIYPEALPQQISENAGSRVLCKNSAHDSLTPLQELERAEIVKGLELYGKGEQAIARIALELGISTATVYRRLKAYHL